MKQNEFDDPMSRNALPSPEEIDSVIFDIMAADKNGGPDNTSLDELWASEAFDPQRTISRLRIRQKPI
jgi:hypothetical protein